MLWIAEEIDGRGGAVPFEEYMDLALYHPVHGYYSGEMPRYGRDGDFLTAPSASEWYPRVLARLLSELAACVGPLRFVDVASGDGALVGGVLKALDAKAGAVLAEVVSVERSPSMWSRQRERFEGSSVQLKESLAEVVPSAFHTVLHASELFDAQPVVRVVMRSSGLCEFWVKTTDGGLAWEERPAREDVAGYFGGYGVTLVEGQVAEANLGAQDLHRELLATVGGHGLAVVLDYGYESHRLYDSRGRAGGSLATFRRHRLGRNPLESPGELDLTAHVNWDDLYATEGTLGWTGIGLWPLAEFLIRAGIADEIECRGFGMEAELDAATVAARQEVKRLLDPEGMGSDLKVLVQGRGELIDAARSLLSIE